MNKSRATSGILVVPGHDARIPLHRHRDGLPDHGQAPVELLGSVKLVELKVRDVDLALASWLSGCQPGALGWPG